MTAPVPRWGRVRFRSLYPRLAGLLLRRCFDSVEVLFGLGRVQPGGVYRGISGFICIALMGLPHATLQQTEESAAACII